MGSNGRTHFEFRHPLMSLPLPGLPSISTFYDPFSNDSLLRHIQYIEQCSVSAIAFRACARELARTR